MKRLFLVTIFLAGICCAFNNGHVIKNKRTMYGRSTDTITLPDTYTKRKFMTGDAVSNYDAVAIPGNIVKYDSIASTYEFETMTALIKGNKQPTMQAGSGTIFSGTIPSDSRFNGSPIIDGIKAEKNQVIDLEIKDDMTYTVADGQIDTAAIRSALKATPADARRSLFYISSATVSVINYKIHDAETVIDRLSKKADKLTKPDTAKKGISIKPKPSNKPSPFSLSNNNTKTVTDKVISVQLIPVDHFFNAAGKK